VAEPIIDLPKQGLLAIKGGMKAAAFVIIAFSIAGCATKSKFANDPRAEVIGPDYLDYIVKYPPDKDTEFYAPWFTVNGHQNEPSYGVQNTHPLEIDVQAPPQAVKDIAGKGYPLLEQKSGLLVFTGTNYQMRLKDKPSASVFRQFWVP
jgi:hypothetical protein